jgi:beta-glucosidase/6-phospho-beta-glucosidase/beta-galactosidase
MYPGSWYLRISAFLKNMQGQRGNAAADIDLKDLRRYSKDGCYWYQKVIAANVKEL